MADKNTLKVTWTWLNVWLIWATEIKVNPRIEEYKDEQLEEEVRRSNFVEYIINKNRARWSCISAFIDIF